ncbi:MAG: hypothetical protein IKP65_08145 [Alphaproteobacteria bacterium]|nr:hypothetical protein [Alphaproteobacteria bacterium]
MIARNEYDVDKYISLENTYSDLIQRSFYNGIVNMKNHNDIQMNCDNIQKYCTISFWIKINKMPSDKDISIIKGQDNNLLSISITDQLLKITGRNDRSEFNIELQKKKWYHICLVMSKSIITCYVNFFDIYYHKITAYYDYDNHYNIGHDEDIIEGTKPDYDICSIVVFNEAKNQNQVNKLYLS